MGWERLGNGGYYYRKRRIGERVISEYIGSRELAGAISTLDEYERKMRALEKQAKKREREAMQSGDAALLIER